MTTDPDASGNRQTEIDEPSGTTVPCGCGASRWMGAGWADVLAPAGTEGDRGDLMSDLLGLAFDVAVSGIGSLALGYMAWQLNTYVRQAGTMPRRAARLWKWRIVLGLCGSLVVIGFGANDLFVHHARFYWLLLLEAGAGAGFAGVLFTTNNPEWNAPSQPREPDDDPTDDDLTGDDPTGDDPTGDDLPLRQQQPPDRD